MLYFNKTQSLLGQAITFIPFTLLPLKHFIQFSTSLNFKQKINNAFLVCLVFLCLLLPFIIIKFYLTKKKENSGRKISQTNNRMVAMKFIKDSLQFQQLTAEQKYNIINAFINLTVPILIIFPITWPFFIINNLLYSYRIYISTKLLKYSVSCIISSSFFLFFHLSFYFSYLSLSWNNEEMFAYMTFFCFFSMVLGGFYELASFIIQIFVQMFKWLKDNLRSSRCFKNSIENQNCAKIQSKQGENIQIYPQSNCLNLKFKLTKTKRCRVIKQSKDRKRIQNKTVDIQHEPKQEVQKKIIQQIPINKSTFQPTLQKRNQNQDFTKDVNKNINQDQIQSISGIEVIKKQKFHELNVQSIKNSEDVK